MDSYCEVCQTEAETSGHLFWSFSNAKEVWRMSKLFSRQMNLLFASFMDLIWYVTMVIRWERDIVDKIMMIAWAMWTDRNKVRNGEEKKCSKAVMDYAREYLREYQACCKNPAVAQQKE